MCFYQSRWKVGSHWRWTPIGLQINQSCFASCHWEIHVYIVCSVKGECYAFWIFCFSMWIIKKRYEVIQTSNLVNMRDFRYVSRWPHYPIPPIGDSKFGKKTGAFLLFLALKRLLSLEQINLKKYGVFLCTQMLGLWIITFAKCFLFVYLI